MHGIVVYVWVGLPIRESGPQHRDVQSLACPEQSLNSTEIGNSTCPRENRKQDLGTLVSPQTHIIGVGPCWLPPCYFGLDVSTSS